MMDSTEKIEYPREIIDIVRNMTLFDDDLMSMVFDNNIEAADLLLRVILERNDLETIEVTGQRELENPIVGGRNIRLDILAKHSMGKLYDVEVQRDNGGAHIRGARFHSSMIDVRMLKEKQKFKELRDSYVIFITEKDYMMKGLPLYHINRVIEETGENAEDGSHIIYVNGSYRGDDPVGQLMHDFSCGDSEKIVTIQSHQNQGEK